MLIGEKGKIFSPDDYGSQFFLLLDSKGYQPHERDGKEHEAMANIPKTIPRAPRNGPRHNQEWFEMMRSGTPAYSNFDIAAYLTEIILLGCVAMRVGVGKEMKWDGPNMKSTNLPEAAKFVQRDYQNGYKL